MSAFLIVAALMAAIAASFVAIPLLRDKRSRIIGAVAACLVAAAAAGLYPLWSNWDWHAPVQAQSMPAPDVLAMVGKLEQHLRDDPNDLAGWLMLGRSYLALQRMDDAVNAYDRAHRLNGSSAEAALGLGEAISLRAGGQISPEASALFEDALKLEPNNPKALLYGGFAAATRGDRATARSRWQAEGFASAAANRGNVGRAHRLTWCRRGIGDECVAGGDERECSGVGSGPGHCQYTHSACIKIALETGDALVRIRS
jgi:cytochrome c-type biogenesis protein CcmH